MYDLESSARRLYGSAGLLLNELGDQACPAGLMAGANAGPIVPMKVFIEEDKIAPVRVALEAVFGAEDGPSPVAVAQEEAYETARQLVGDLAQSQEVA